MANPLLKRLLGEAAEDPVEHHLNTLGAGVPPEGRSYPEMPPPKLDADETNMGNPEEAREVQIAREILKIAHNLAGDASGPYSTSRSASHSLKALADELISMHGQAPE